MIYVTERHVPGVEFRSGKERRQGGDTLTAPDAPRDAGTGMARGARPRPAVVRCDKPPSQCGEYGGTHQPGKPNAFCDCRCHDTIDSAEDIDYESVDFVHSILQAEIDRDLLARAQHPSYRRKLDEHAGLELHRRSRIRWVLHDWWRRAVWREIPVQPRNVASPGLSWGSEHVTPVDARPGGSQVVGLGPEVHGEPVERVGDRSHVRANDGSVDRVMTIPTFPRCLTDPRRLGDRRKP